MRFTGFLNEYDNDRTKKTFKDFVGKGKLDIELLNKVIDYLSNGINVGSWMHVIYDLNTSEKIVEGHGVETDGVWAWPSYLIHYLKEYPSYHVDEEFLNHLIAKNFSIDWSKDTLDIIAIEKDVYG